MLVRLSAHGAYMHLYHIVWIPKYRRKVLRGEVKTYINERLREIEEHVPDVQIYRLNIQIDHVHLIITIPPKHAVSTIVGKMKQNSSREVREKFPAIKKLYWKPEFWSPGFFSSTIGLNEETIRKYVEFQEKQDKGLIQMKLFQP